MEETPRRIHQTQFNGSKPFYEVAGGYIIRRWDDTYLQVVAFNLDSALVVLAEATTIGNEVKAST